MKNWFVVLLGAAVVLFPAMVSATPTSVDWRIINTLDLPETPRDMAINADGRVYLLGTGGKIKVVAADGGNLGVIDAGINADRIHLGPKGERLYVSDRKGRKVKVIALTDIVAIPVDGSPFLGAAEAAITVVVFSDFQ